MRESFLRRHPLLFKSLKWAYKAASLDGTITKLKKNVQLRYDFSKIAEKAAAEKDKRFEMSWHARLPKLDDNTGTSTFDAHYVYHTAWAARLISLNRPSEHHDFASDIRFATLVSAFVPMIFYDYRPLLVNLQGLTTLKADLENIDLMDGSVHSLSCMHVVEHIGLGRYGDPIDPLGDLKAIGELKRILAPDGDLYFVVPVGRPQLRFNAHRIYTFGMVQSYFKELSLQEFSLVNDAGRFISNADWELADRQDYGCGCFWFKKTKK